MPFESLHYKYPQLAAAETRAIILPSPDNEFGLPPGSYLFMEMFCNEKDCDCRRVMFSVFADNQKEQLACLGYGWESESFYKKWMRTTDKAMARKLMKSSLVEMAPQSIYAGKILRMFNRCLLPQTSYLARVKEHYQFFRKNL